MYTTCKIHAYPVPELGRQGFLAASFGSGQVARARTLLSEWMTSLSEREERPQWRFFLLSNDGFYVAPIQLTSRANLYRGRAFNGRLSSNAAGIIATLLTLAQLARESRAHELLAAHDRLLEFAQQHAEWISINYVVTSLRN